MACTRTSLSLAITLVSYGKSIFLGFLAVGLGACRPSRESITAGQIGCNPDEIQISDENSSMGVESEFGDVDG